MRRPSGTALVGNLILFQLLWLAAVLGAARDEPLWAPLALALLLVWGPVVGGSLRADVRMLIAGALAAVGVEMLWIVPGLIEYRLHPLSWLPPLWILALWMGFAVSFRYGLFWLQERPVTAMLVGAIGGATSLATGIHLGAAEAPLGLAMLLLVYALAWGVLVPLLARLARLADQDDYCRAPLRSASSDK